MTASFLSGLWSVSPLGALVGVLLLLFWMLATGRLLTRSAHLEILKSHERLADIQQEAIREWRTSTHALEVRAVVLPSQQAADRIVRGGPQSVGSE